MSEEWFRREVENEKKLKELDTGRLSGKLLSRVQEEEQLRRSVEKVDVFRAQLDYWIEVEKSKSLDEFTEKGKKA